MEVDAPETPEAPFDTLLVLQLIKDAQQKHGLRHGDYERYRGYCARRLTRIRKALKCTHGHKCVPKHRSKFQSRPITAEVVSEVRHLELLVFEVERHLAYAMQLKYEASVDPLSRKKFHMANKLRRAVKHSIRLEQITRGCNRANATTKLEVRAYHAFVGATLCLELKQYSNAVELFKTSKVIYEELANVTRIPKMAELYQARLKEVQNLLKVCEHHVVADASEVIPELELLKLEDSNKDLDVDFKKLSEEMSVMEVVPEPVVADESETKTEELPRIQPMPCKPVFFDLALFHIKLPDLNARMRELQKAEKPPTPKESPVKKPAEQKTAPAPAKSKAAPAPSSSKAANKSQKAAPAASAPSEKKNKKEAAEKPATSQEQQGGLSSYVKGFFWGSK